MTKLTDPNSVEHTRKFLWLWTALALITMVSLVGRVLDFQATDTLVHRIFVPGCIFVVSAIGALLNLKTLKRQKRAMGLPTEIFTKSSEPDDKSPDQVDEQ